jgi:hypothetical protein
VNKAVKQLAIALMRKRVGNGKPSKAQRKREKLARKTRAERARKTNPFGQPIADTTVGTTTSKALGPAANE